METVVDTIMDRLSSLNLLVVGEDLVGMRAHIEELESSLDIGSIDVRMVGLVGMGGVGKTALAFSLYMKISQCFQGHCYIENVREKSSKYGLKKLQENILRAVSKTEVKVQSVAEGKVKIKTMLCCQKVLIILDDVDDLEQLDALVGSHDWFGSGSRIIITTRDEYLLRTHKVDNTYHMNLLSHDEAIQLFKRHAYNEDNPIEDYETLSSSIISCVEGHPLALKVLGAFLYDKDRYEWTSALAKLKAIPYDGVILNTLIISYDGLATYLKELFLDIACFFRGWKTDEAMEILETCNHAKKGIKVLRQKFLISIVDGRFEMHDIVQAMGLQIVGREHLNNPKRQTRVWKAKENDTIEGIIYDGYSRDHDHSTSFCEIVSRTKKLRWFSKAGYSDGDVDADGPSFLSNELRYIHWEVYPTRPFPENFKPMNLMVLKLWGSMQKVIWKGNKHLPNLKVLELKYMWELLNTPDFDRLPRLQKLTLCSCKELEEIHPSFGNHTSLEYLSVSECPKLRMFPTIVHMKNLKSLEIKDCFLKDGEIPSGIGELSNLQELSLCGNDFTRLDFSLLQLTQLKSLDISYCVKLLELPALPSNSSILKADYCSSLTSVGDCFNYCEQLYQVSLMGGGIITDGDRLLQLMLEGKAIENGSMRLRLKGLDVAQGFTSPLLRGRRCILQLPENWCNNFCGFLICAVLPNYFHWSDPASLIISHVTSDMHSEDAVVWEEGDDDKHTFVWYVSFGSLRYTTWWDQTYKAHQTYKSLSFNIEDYKCCGIGVRLVAKTAPYLYDRRCHLEIEDDSDSTLRIALNFSDPKFVS